MAGYCDKNERLSSRLCSITNFDDWVRMDLEHIRDRSLWLDCKILAKTAWVVVRGTGS